MFRHDSRFARTASRECFRLQEWIDGLEAKGTLAEKEAWRPWYTGGKSSDRAPAGYATSYSVTGGDHDFSFVTIRLAGHMVRRL